MLLAQSRGWMASTSTFSFTEVLELDLSLKTPGLQEMEKHSADIPAKFKPAAWQKDVFFLLVQMINGWICWVIFYPKISEKDP